MTLSLVYGKVSLACSSSYKAVLIAYQETQILVMFQPLLIKT